MTEMPWRTQYFTVAANGNVAYDPALEGALSGAGIVFAVQTPGPSEIALIPRGCLLVCIAGAFGNTDLVGNLASHAAGLVNWTNRNPFLRGQMEKFLGIHRDRLLPSFHSETFAKWFQRRPRRAVSGSNGHLSATSADISMARCVVIAPIAIMPPRDLAEVAAVVSRLDQVQDSCSSRARHHAYLDRGEDVPGHSSRASQASGGRAVTRTPSQ
jgi:hypothetical protein